MFVIGFLVGLSLLLYGISLAVTNFIVLGTGLIDISVLGILVAGLLIGLLQRRKILDLEAETLGIERRFLLEINQELKKDIKANEEKNLMVVKKNKEIQQLKAVKTDLEQKIKDLYV